MAGAPHIEAFLEAADYFVGLEENPDGSNRFTDPRGAEMCSLAGFSSGGSWCAILVSACAAKAGVDWEVIALGEGVGGVTSNTVDYLDGEWIEGPYFTRGSVTPMPGDLISFVGSPASTYSGYEHGGHIGLVEYVDDDGVHTIEGNCGNECKRVLHAIDSPSINGYVRPKWENVGDDVSAYRKGVKSISVGPLYQNKNDRHDMTMREVGYLDADYNLTDKKTGIAISIINYTTVLGELWNMFAATTTNTPTIDTSKLDGEVKIAMDFFLSNGFSASASSGIVGCLQTYSGINTKFSRKVEDKVYLYGICAWGGDKLKQMESSVGKDWNINLSGQLGYLLGDLNASYKGLIQALKNSDLDETSAKECAQTFIANYNQYKNDYNTIGDKEKAKQYAVDVFSRLVITYNNVVGNPSDIRDKDGNKLNVQFSIDIPSSVSQTGIIDDFTSYSAYYPKWDYRSPQRKLADMWAAMGCPCDKGVATIGGYYCVAVRPKFGSCGDVIVVTLEDGSAFSAIICDEKGDDAGSEWGHVKGNGRISLIEWERIVTYNGEVQTEGASAYIVDGHGFDDWLYQDVVNITNYGKYSDVRWT